MKEQNEQKMRIIVEGAVSIYEGDPLLTTLTLFDRFCMAIHSVVERYNK